MPNRTLSIQYTELAPSALDAQTSQLVNQALSACDKAYSPYSQFSVGAAVLLENGMVFCGNNQENASFPAAICAERSALMYAHSNYPQQAVTAIAIVAKTKGSQTAYPVSPCGVCRQVLLESEKRAGKSIQVILSGVEMVRIFDCVQDLIPFGFDNF